VQEHAGHQTLQQEVHAAIPLSRLANFGCLLTVMWQETMLFDRQWQDQVAAFEASIARQMIELKEQQQEQVALLAAAWESQRPSKPQHSAQYLNHRKIEETLVKQVRSTHSGMQVWLIGDSTLLQLSEWYH